jgi:predicted Mrr-cat superfamily restriction endonuclease
MVVRAGRDAIYVEDFLEKKMVAIGWSQVGDLSGLHSREQVAAVLIRGYPNTQNFSFP